MSESEAAPARDGYAIVVEGLTRVFRRQTAVDHVSFRVARGGRLALAHRRKPSRLRGGSG